LQNAIARGARPNFRARRQNNTMHLLLPLGLLHDAGSHRPMFLRSINRRLRKDIARTLSLEISRWVLNAYPIIQIDGGRPLCRSRELLGAMPRVVEPEEVQAAAPDEPRVQPCTCPRCGARMIIIEVFARGCEPRYRPAPAPTPMRIDTS
jgi:hypothetical protein